MGVDWSKRDSAKAKMRVAVRRLLKNMAIHQIYKNGCRASVEQAELMASNHKNKLKSIPHK